MARRTATDRALAAIDAEIAILQAVRARLVAAVQAKPVRLIKRVRVTVAPPADPAA